ncbi:hypothetical protein EGW08_014132 [Elysia chlorotica]|uniref:SCAN box domain-containing protein n=1 Tax=Elysia chlorotica TaxID=188477 RepID=A0A433T9I9_ELYCH|nr:hypothetical protein EGW08_014132 [Elysia chlorotica]
MSEVATRLAAEVDAMELRGPEKKLYIKEGLEKEREEKRRQQLQELEEKRRQEKIAEKRRQEEIAEKRRQEEIEERRRREEREHELAMLRIKAEHPGVADPSEVITKSNAKLPKLLSFVDYKDDLDSWLLRFERFAETSQWQKESWAAYLSALLPGRALDCFCRLSTEDAKNYDAIKLALQKRQRQKLGHCGAESVSERSGAQRYSPAGRPAVKYFLHRLTGGTVTAKWFSICLQ